MRVQTRGASAAATVVADVRSAVGSDTQGGSGGSVGKKCEHGVAYCASPVTHPLLFAVILFGALLLPRGRRPSGAVHCNLICRCLPPAHVQRSGGAQVGRSSYSKLLWSHLKESTHKTVCSRRERPGGDAAARSLCLCDDLLQRLRWGLLSRAKGEGQLLPQVHV